MLFKSTINKEIVKSEEALVEQLYIFLDEYIPTRLIYEGYDERQDCVQEAIMYLLKRFRALTEEEISTVNLEKFFYNRARSYVSLYLRSLKKSRADTKSYIELLKDLGQYATDIIEYYIDETLLTSIISSYKLSKNSQNILKKICIIKLKELGFSTTKSAEDLVYSDREVLVKLSPAVVDEYMIESAARNFNELKGETAIGTTND